MWLTAVMRSECSLWCKIDQDNAIGSPQSLARSRTIMSHYSVVQTRMTDVTLLVQALADLELTNVEVHATPQHLFGVGGDSRSQTAEVIIRRQRLSWLSNDIGFKRTADGSFEAIISDYDRQKYSHPWLQSLVRRYAYHAARTKLEEKGFALVAENTEATGQIHLVLRRMA
jgi:hypothetical protein